MLVSGEYAGMNSGGHTGYGRSAFNQTSGLGSDMSRRLEDKKAVSNRQYHTAEQFHLLGIETSIGVKTSIVLSSLQGYGAVLYELLEQRFDHVPDNAYSIKARRIKRQGPAN